MTVTNYAVLVTSEVVESVWILAESEAQALDIARYSHLNHMPRHELDRAVHTVRIVGAQPLLTTNESPSQ